MPRRSHVSGQTVSVLVALLGSESWRHGVSLSKETGVKPGTLYPMLARLHDDGFLEAEWQPSQSPGRPPRHVYRLNAAGRALALSREAERNRGWKEAPA